MENPAPARESTPGRRTRIALLLICMVACALFAIGAIRFYFGPGFLLTFGSDAAVPVLLANEVLKTGRLLPATWYFANNEIWTLSPHVFVMPFVAAFGVSTLALKLGNALCVAAMVVFLALPLHRVTRSWPYAILVATGVFSAFSPFQEMGIYSQTAYGWFCAQFALMIYLALRMQDESTSGGWRVLGNVSWTTALYALVLVNLAIDSPLRAGVYWVAPVVAVAVLFPLSKMRARALATLTITAFAVGFGLHVALSREVLTRPGLTATLLKPIGEWPASLGIVASGLPIMIGYAKQWSATLLDALGVARFYVFASAGAVVLIAPTGNGPGSAECQFFARVCGAMLLAVLAVLMVGRLATDEASIRYLLPPALLCLAAFMAILWCRLSASTYGITAIAALFVLMFGGGAVMLVSRHAAPAVPCDAPGDVCRLQSLLSKTGVHHGYATYWNGNATTVATHGEITACGVVLTPKLTPFRWLVSKDCFDVPQDDRYFLALDRAEIAKAGRDYLISEAGTPDSVVSDAKYEIWIYATATAKLDWLQR